MGAVSVLAPPTRCPRGALTMRGVAACLWSCPRFGDRTGPVSEQEPPSARHVLGHALHHLTLSSTLGSGHDCSQVTDQKTEAPACLAMLGLEVPRS